MPLRDLPDTKADPKASARLIRSQSLPDIQMIVLIGVASKHQNIAFPRSALNPELY
jgi:hypothetical protein